MTTSTSVDATDDLDSVPVVQVRIRVPQPIRETQRPSVPVLAALTPIVGAVAIWAFTHSPYSLVFAALGPITAAGGYLDARRRSAVAARSEQLRFTAESEAFGDELAAAHARERALAEASSPGARSVLDGRAPHDTRGRRSSDPVELVLGRGAVASRVRLEGAADVHDDGAADVVLDSPLVLDDLSALGVVGTEASTAAYTRSLVAQLAHAWEPAALAFDAPASVEWDWLREYPHSAVVARSVSAAGTPSPAAPLVVEFSDEDSRSGERWGREPRRPAEGGSRTIRIAVARRAAGLPPGVGCIVDLEYGTGRAAVVGRVVRGARERVAVDLVTLAESACHARSVHVRTRSPGRAERVLPVAVDLSGLIGSTIVDRPGHERGAATAIDETPTGWGSSLRCSFAVGTGGAVDIDLVGDGPHAIVGGTTGSGKSELLVSWVASMAHAYPVDALAVLLVDFKGGSAFSPLAVLPHCVGVITDLGPHEAFRALDGLRAEMYRRERLLADRMVKDITGLAARELPRLVIVVDEVASLLAAGPEMQTLFADIAARGRSLGVHLILCTQRPSGVVREAVAANCGLRLSLRVNSAADSVSVVGSAAAAELAPSTPGRCVVARDGWSEVVQIAATNTSLIADIARRRRDERHRPIHRPWSEPLPAMIALDTLDGTDPRFPEWPVRDRRDASELILGVSDVPSEQRQSITRWSPESDGHLLVVGGAQSGASSMMRMLAAQAGRTASSVVEVGQDLELAWDAVTAAARFVDDDCGGRRTSDATRSDTTLVIDDLDEIVRRLPGDHQRAFLDALVTVLRSERTVGRSRIHVAASVHRLNDGLTSIAPHFRSTLLLRSSSKQEHVMHGGAAAGFDPTLPPGGGVYNGHRIQAAWVEPASDQGGRAVGTGGGGPLVAPDAVDVELDRVVAVVTSKQERTRRRLVAEGRRVDAAAGGAARDRVDVLVPPVAPAVLVGDPNDWHGFSGRGAVFSRGIVVFDGVSAADLRMLTGERGPAPFVSSTSGRVLVHEVGRPLRRGTWPASTAQKVAPGRLDPLIS